MRNFAFDEYLAHQKDRVDAALHDFFSKKNSLFDIMYYSVDGGKRIRPILAIAGYEACGGKETEVIVRVACGLELIHTYSLIHDDLPAMDNDDLRRGKASSHRQFSEALAILSGDALFAYAYELFSSGKDHVSEKLEVIRGVSQAVGPNGVVYGQMLDISELKKEPQILRSIHLNKTAKFIAVAIKVGAIMAGASKSVIEELYSAGIYLGMLFQYTDDILDVVGKKSALGKTPGKDEASGKLTAPAIYGLAGAKFRALRYAAHARDRFNALGDDFRFFSLMTDFVLNRSF